MEFPALVAVPVIAPVLEFKLKPAGRAPLEIDHVYGNVPPVATAVCEYAAPSVPPGNADVEMTRVAGATAIDSG